MKQKNISDELSDELTASLWVSIRNSLGYSLYNSIGDSLGYSLYDWLGNSLCREYEFNNKENV